MVELFWVFDMPMMRYCHPEIRLTFAIIAFGGNCGAFDEVSKTGNHRIVTGTPGAPLHCEWNNGI